MMKKKEILIIIGILILCFGFLFFRFLNHKKNSQNKYLIVSLKNEIVLEKPLSEDLNQKIEGDTGYNVIIIKNGKASVSEADCENQICVQSKEISDPGETIACLPHGLLLEIQTR